MANVPKHPKMTPEDLKTAIETESEKFELALHWLEDHMPPSFLDEIDENSRILIAHNLVSFSIQDCFSQIHLRHKAIVLCLDDPEADLKILKEFGLYAIRYYRAFVSNEPPPFFKGAPFLRIALIVFAECKDEGKIEPPLKDEIEQLVLSRNPAIQPADMEVLWRSLTPRFMRSMAPDRLSLSLELFFRAKTRDLCQYEVRRNEDWKSKDAPSLQLVLAWRAVPKHRFLYRLAETVKRHNLVLQKIVAAYVEPYSTDNVLILSLGLHGQKGHAAWEEADIDDLMKEIALLKWLEIESEIYQTFVKTRLLTGNEAHLIGTLACFVHQVLVHADPHLYSYEHVLEGFTRHPELTVQLASAFRAKFHPRQQDLEAFGDLKQKFLELVDNLDTGQSVNDQRRKNILKQAMNATDCTLKTNFYRNNKSAFSFRLDPNYLNHVPYDRKEKFPELPYGVFFIRGLYFIGYHIRFKDLARGGVRTVMTEKQEQFLLERNSIFAEAYNLAYTQQKKNKDIPEGGAKAAILLEPFDRFAKEVETYKREMESIGYEKSIIEEKLKIYRMNHKIAFLYASQRSFTESFVTLVNCDEDGTLRAKHVVDYWKRPEYIYFGPDENMHNVMIEWIANYAVERGYRPGRSFMSSKPGAGINHKEFGVTSYGVNVYMHETLLALGIDPDTTPFTVKISGGPDGDVAGNQILNLYRFYPKTAKLLALVDVSGTIYDPLGLDLKEMAELFHKSLPIRNYPPEKLSEGSFLLDLRTKREQTTYAQQTLCWKKQQGKLLQEWLSGNEMNHLFRNNVHQTKTDVFIPGGGRPRTLNETNVQSFLDETGKPTSKAIIEGANLYLTPGARRALEKLGVLILKDSSCNKGGVICSSFEVLSSLCLSEEEFLQEKDEFVQEVLEIIKTAALHEARLLLSAHQQTGESLVDLSEKVSEKINLYKYQLLDYLEARELPSDPHDPLIRCLMLYCPPLLRKKYATRILQMPEIHKKAIISCYIGARLVYTRGLDWSPTVLDILPTIAQDPHLCPE